MGGVGGWAGPGLCPRSCPHHGHRPRHSNLSPKVGGPTWVGGSRPVPMMQTRSWAQQCLQESWGNQSAQVWGAPRDGQQKSANFFFAPNIFSAPKHFLAPKKNLATKCVWAPNKIWRQQIWWRQKVFWRHIVFWHQMFFGANETKIGANILLAPKSFFGAIGQPFVR